MTHWRQERPMRADEGRGLQSKIGAKCWEACFRVSDVPSAPQLQEAVRPRHSPLDTRTKDAQDKLAPMPFGNLTEPLYRRDTMKTAKEALRACLGRQRRHSYQPRATPWVYRPKTILSAESAVHCLAGLRPGPDAASGFELSGPKEPYDAGRWPAKEQTRTGTQGVALGWYESGLWPESNGYDQFPSMSGQWNFRKALKLARIFHGFRRLEAIQQVGNLGYAASGARCRS